MLFLLWTGLANAQDSPNSQGEDPDPLPAPKLESHTSMLSDDQPYERLISELGVSAWITPRLELGANVEAGRLGAGAARLSFLGGSGRARFRLVSELVDLSAELGGRAWSDTHRWAHASLGSEFFPTGPVRLRASAYRSDELSTFEAALWHILQDGASAELRLVDFHGFSGALSFERHFYSDQNAGLSASAWLLFCVLTEPLRLELGYAGAYRDTDYSRWNPFVNRYLPYMTPLDSSRHGPIVALGATIGFLDAAFSASGALWGQEDDPTTLGLFELRRSTEYLETRASLGARSGAASLGLVHTFLRETYYVAHTLELNFRVEL